MFCDESSNGQTNILPALLGLTILAKLSEISRKRLVRFEPLRQEIHQHTNLGR